MTDGVLVSALSVVRSGRALVGDLSFAAPFGSITAVLGPNGAGKTTLLKAMAGVIAYTGDITLNGESVRGSGRLERARRIAYVPQRSELEAPLSVREVVAQGRYPHRARWGAPQASDRDVIARAMEDADVTALRDRSFATLSYGERQRALVARALATDARVLLLDEPTSALDIKHALQLCALLRTLAREGYCIVMALHGLQEAFDWTDQAVLLNRGRLVAVQPTRALFSSSQIETTYGVRILHEAAMGFRLP
jgi:iron complex transport system ATP-binding protein